MIGMSLEGNICKWYSNCCTTLRS